MFHNPGVLPVNPRAGVAATGQTSKEKMKRVVTSPGVYTLSDDPAPVVLDEAAAGLRFRLQAMVRQDKDGLRESECFSAGEP